MEYDKICNGLKAVLAEILSIYYNKSKFSYKRNSGFSALSKLVEQQGQLLKELSSRMATFPNPVEVSFPREVTPVTPIPTSTSSSVVVDLLTKILEINKMQK